MNKIRLLVIGAIIASVLPWFVLLGNVDGELWESNRTLFWFQLSKSLGSALGFIGVVLFLWQFVLGSRLLSRVITRDGVWINGVHKWVGMYGSVFVLIHPLLEMYRLSEELAFLFVPSFVSEYQFHLSLGRFALILFLVIYVTSALVRGRIAYRPWKYIHYLAYPMVFFALLHARDIGSTLAKYSWLNGLWTAVVIGYVVFVVYRVSSAAGFGRRQYIVEERKEYGDGNTVLKMRPLGKRIVPEPGQYCYVQGRRFGESHPFSVMEYDKKTGLLTFGIKALGRFSRSITRAENGDRLFLDGPYGVFTREAQNDAPKVIIAGGIGVTPFIDVVKKHSNEHTYMLNCNRRVEDAVYRDELRAVLGERYVDIISHEEVDGDQMVQGRITAEIIRDHIPDHVLDDANVFFCGSPGLYAAVKRMLTDCGVPRERIFYEEFSL